MSEAPWSEPTFPVVCIHADAQGISHLIDLELPAMSRRFREDGTSEFGGIEAATTFGVVPKLHNAPKFIDWHISQMTGFSIVLSGEWEIEAGSGQRRVLGTGSVLLMLDTTGQGHRAHYSDPARAIGIGIAAETEARYRAILAAALAEAAAG